MQCLYFNFAATLQAVKTRRVSLKTKINKCVLVLGKGPPGGRPGPGPGSAAGAAAGLRVCGHVQRQASRGAEDSYFHKGHDNLNGQGPGYIIVKLGLAGAGPGASPPARAARWLVELPAY